MQIKDIRGTNCHVVHICKEIYKNQGAGNSPFSNTFGKLQGKHMDKVLKNCASHSRYFSDELGALFFKKQAEQMFVFSLCIWYNKNMDKNMFNINNNEFSYGR